MPNVYESAAVALRELTHNRHRSRCVRLRDAAAPIVRSAWRNTPGLSPEVTAALEELDRLWWAHSEWGHACGVRRADALADAVGAAVALLLDA